MLRHKLATILILLTTAATLSGCVYSREIAHTRRDIERHTGAEFNRQVRMLIARKCTDPAPPGLAERVRTNLWGGGTLHS